MTLTGESRRERIKEQGDGDTNQRGQVRQGNREQGLVAQTTVTRKGR